MATSPPPSKVDQPEIAAALAERDRLAEEAVAAKQDAVEATFAVERAEEGDRQAEADHIRGVVKTKPRAAAPKAIDAAAAAQRKASVLAIAAADAEAELGKALDEHGPALWVELDGQLEANRESCRATVRALAELVAEGERVRSLRAWIGDGEDVPRRRPYGVGSELRSLDLAFASQEERIEAARGALSEYRHPRAATSLNKDDLFRWLVDAGWEQPTAREAVQRFWREWEKTRPQPRPLKAVGGVAA